MDTILVFVVIFVIFMLIWIVGLWIARLISKKKLNNFRNYIQENLPGVDLEKDKVLIAKQTSKQLRPDIALLINDAQEEIIILQEFKGTGMTHHRYHFDDLRDVESSTQIISRGLFPKTHSYEERLHLEFVDNESFDLILENISNKRGDDQGAEVVKNLFSPWRRKLNLIIKDRDQ